MSPKDAGFDAGMVWLSLEGELVSASNNGRNLMRTASLSVQMSRQLDESISMLQAVLQPMRGEHGHINIV